MIDIAIQKQIASVLRNIGSPTCLEQAELLESTETVFRSLHLRGLELNFWHIEAIANCLKQAEGRCNQLKSVSFSYNSLGNAGVATLIKSLPSSVTEIGLVNCGISDTGGTEILDWMKNRQNIQMVCIEQNNYSTALRAVFQSFSNTHPDILFVF